MQINASMVKELRERTGAGMMECKKALAESGGDMEVAIEQMRKSGLAKADKKAGRVAAEGMIAAALTDNQAQAAMVEVNSETDFVAKGDDFQKFARGVADQVLTHGPADLDALGALPIDGDSDIEKARQDLVAKLGENIQVRRFEKMISEGGHIGAYLHGNRIGVLVDLKGGDTELARDVAMHVAASRPVCVDEQQVPTALLEKEREIFKAQAEQTGKPPEIIAKMVQGRLKKYLGEVTLLGQPFVKDPDKTVGALLKARGAEVARYVRFEVGEGIEKKSGDFASEVMAQVKGD